MKQYSILLLLLVQSISLKSYMVGGWVPYWTPKAGTSTITKHLTVIDQVSPFAYEVQADGSLKDTFSKHAEQWQNLAQQCATSGKLLIPCVSWHNTKQMHDILSDTKKRALHVATIMALVIDNSLAGININYENIHPQDRQFYQLLLEDLSKRLHQENRLLHITLGARTSDTTVGIIDPFSEAQEELSSPGKVNVSLSPGNGSTADSYKECIARCADQLIVMAYDEWGIPYNRQASYRTNNYYVAHASNQWVEQVIEYALTFVPHYKLVIAAPTYGLEFIITDKTPTEIAIKKKRSVLYDTAQELILQRTLTPKRTPGGEMSLTYTEDSQTHYVVYSDAQTIKDKVDLIKKYDLKGLYLFAIYGNEDENIWKLFETRA